MTLLSASGVTVRAGGAVLLDAVSLAVAAGETVALVGPNGAGKSTLLKVLSGEIRPAAGDVALKGRAVAAYPPRALAAHRAVLPQSVALNFPFTVEEIVCMGAGDRALSSVAHEIEAALRAVDLLPHRHRIMTTLSGGEQQRAHFARILVQLACGEAEQGPGLLLLDEPTASLDLRHQLDLLQTACACAARGTAVVAVLHDLNLATLFARRIVMLSGGRVVADGPPRETVTDALLQRVFAVSAAVGRVPEGVPFVLPHGIAR